MAGKSIFFGVVGLVAGLALGVSMGQLFHKPPRTEHSPSAPVMEMSRRVVQSTAAATTPGSEEIARRSETTAPFEKLRELCANTRECDVGQCLLLIKELSAAECREAVTLFRRLPQGESALLTQALARRWASLDADVVLEEAVRMNDRSSGQIFALEGARALVARDPEAALAKLTARGDALYRLFLGRPILSALAEKDAARAVAFLKGRPEFGMDGDLYGILAVKWSQHDLQQALKWSKELPAGRSRAEAMKGVGQVWAEQDPAAMAAEISRARLEWDREVVTAVAQNWSKRDPRAAQNSEAHYQIARQWALADAEGSANWIGTLQAGPTRDAAIRAFVQSVDGYDAGLATTWATAIEDPRQRRESLTSAFNRWLESDGAQAQAWLAGAQLSEDLRAELARVAEMRRTGK